jgi:hypothetical protein
LLSDLSIARKGLILVLAPAVVGATLLSILTVILINANQQLEALEHSKRALLYLHDFGSSIAQTVLIVGDRGGTETAKLLKLNELERQFSSTQAFGGLNAKEYPELDDLLTSADEMRHMALQLIARTKKVVADPSILPTKRLKAVGRRSVVTAAMELQQWSKRIQQLEAENSAAETKKISDISLAVTLSIGAG